MTAVKVILFLVVYIALLKMFLNIFKRNSRTTEKIMEQMLRDGDDE